MKIFLPLMFTVFLSGCISQGEIVSSYENETKTSANIPISPTIPIPPVTITPPEIPAPPGYISTGVNETYAEFSELYELVKNGTYDRLKSLRDINTTAKLIFADDWSKRAKYENYFFHAPLGSYNKWVKIVITDGNQNNLTVDTLVINEGEIKISKVNLKIFVADVRALADGTVVGSDLWISPVPS